PSIIWPATFSVRSFTTYRFPAGSDFVTTLVCRLRGTIMLSEKYATPLMQEFSAFCDLALARLFTSLWSAFILAVFISSPLQSALRFHRLGTRTECSHFVQHDSRLLT